MGHQCNCCNGNIHVTQFCREFESDGVIVHAHTDPKDCIYSLLKTLRERQMDIDHLHGQIKELRNEKDKECAA